MERKASKEDISGENDGRNPIKMVIWVKQRQQQI
jgi:hypothetical protein